MESICKKQPDDENDKNRQDYQAYNSLTGLVKNGHFAGAN
jgi:hypothetical protein